MIPDLNARVMAGRAKAAAARAAESPTAQAPKPTAKPASPAGDRWPMLNDVVDYIARVMGEAELRTWIILYRDTKKNGLARTGMTDIARRSGMTRRGVVKAIAGLKARGLLEIADPGTIHGKPNTYRLKMPNLVNHGSLP